MIRICTKCLAPMTPAERKPDPRTKDGIANTCKACRKETYQTRSRKPIGAIAGYIYLVRATNDLYKIGITKNLVQRVQEIDRQSPIPTSLVCSAYTSSANFIEFDLHNMFKSCHSHGEWFRLSDEQVQVIAIALDRLAKQEKVK